MTVSKIISMKGKEKITVLTAYDYLTSKILEASGIDIILVGDSLGMVVMGYGNTLPVTLDDIIHHSIAVRNGAKNSFIVSDMPFLSYGLSVKDDIKNAGRIIKECGVNAVKVEGGVEFFNTIRAMVNVGIPVMGHIGLKPQSVNKSGHKIVGKTDAEIDGLIGDAISLEKAGAFAFVIEGTTEEAAKIITESVSIPTIGIGAGRFTDGQVLVITDMLGLDKDTNFKHNKKYADLSGIIQKAVGAYSEEVKNDLFPAEDQTFHKNDA